VKVTSLYSPTLNHWQRQRGYQLTNWIRTQFADSWGLKETFLFPSDKFILTVDKSPATSQPCLGECAFFCCHLSGIMWAIALITMSLFFVWLFRKKLGEFNN